MTAHSRPLGLLAHVTRGLLRHGERRTADHLGDRSTYVGLSDVGRATVCLRSAVAAKLARGNTATPGDIDRWLRCRDENSIRTTLARQLILQRGHWLEAGLEPALHTPGIHLIPQLEITVPDASVPLRAHLDFTLVKPGPSPAIRVLELKSTARLPQTLSPAYEAQLFGQIGLLADYWRQPVFAANGLTGQTFPQLCHRLFGIALPETAAQVDIEGWVLCLSLSEAKAFGPYRPDTLMLGLCRRTAERLWTTAKAVQAARLGLDEVETCAGFQPLCDWCDHAEGCPKFATDPVDDPQIDAALATFARLKAERAALDTEIDRREADIKQFCRHARNHTAWLSSTNFRFRTARIAGRKSIDSARLRGELCQRLGEAEADALITRATITGRDYDRLTVSPRHALPEDEEPMP